MWQTNRQSDASEALWRFSLAFYARPGVAAALLALQDRAGGSVNLLLFALWLGAVRGCALNGHNLAVAEAATAPIDSVVQPLRQLRRELRAATDPTVQALRRCVLTLEIGGERGVQNRLGEVANAFGTDRRSNAFAAAKANLALCLGPEAASTEATILQDSLADLMRHRPRR